VFMPYIPLLDLHLLAHRRLDHSSVLAPQFTTISTFSSGRRHALICLPSSLFAGDLPSRYSTSSN
jgi:hypothetical protein